MEATATLMAGMAFETTIGEHAFTIDANPEHGGENRGPAPKALLLAGLAGCAAMDVISILRKMRQPPESLTVHAAAEVVGEHPKVFDSPVVTVRATGGIDAAKLWRAVALSRDRYCGVSAMLKRHAPIRYVVELDGEVLPEPAGVQTSR